MKNQLLMSFELDPRPYNKVREDFRGVFQNYGVSFGCFSILIIACISGRSAFCVRFWKDKDEF